MRLAGLWLADPWEVNGALVAAAQFNVSGQPA